MLSREISVLVRCGARQPRDPFLSYSALIGILT
jgi:hypothetical protein